MDPVTAALNLANGVLIFVSKVWDAASPDVKTLRANDMLTFNHNIAAFVLSLQEHINAAVQPKP
jgi:hypothetical protein